MDVGAEATEARAERPGREALNELDSNPAVLVLVLVLLALSRLSVSENTLANCDDDAPDPASTPE